MNVLQVVQHLQTGGLEKVVLDLVKNSQYAESTFLVSLEGSRSQALTVFPELKQLGHRLICLEKQPGWQLGVARQLSRICVEHKIDVVHSHHIGPLLYSSMALIGKKHCKHLHTIHDAWFLNTPRHCTLFRFVAMSSNVEFIADAAAVSADVHSKSGVHVPHTILNGIDTRVFKTGTKSVARRKLGLPEFGTLVGCAARLEPGKGHKQLLSAVTKLPQDISLVLAGDGSMRAELTSIAEQMGITKRVHWLGNCQDMPTFYQAIDSFCLFSEREGLPLTLMEAIASKTPVVATNVGGIREIVSDDTGILLSPQKARALPTAIMRSLRWKVAPTRFEHARKRIDVMTMCNRYDSLFNAAFSVGA